MSSVWLLCGRRQRAYPVCRPFIFRVNLGVCRRCHSFADSNFFERKSPEVGRWWERGSRTSARARPNRTRAPRGCESHGSRAAWFHGPRPTGLLRCSALGGPAHNRTGVPADGEAGWCWPAARPSVARLGRQHTSMPLGSGMLPGPALRAHRARQDHRALGLVAPFPVGLACPWLADAPRSTGGSRL